jgi:hypothetical protein
MATMVLCAIVEARHGCMGWNAVAASRAVFAGRSCGVDKREIARR